MPGLFEQFPHTTFHELNLDWMIDLLNKFKQDLEDRAVISVNGMTGEVTLYESENVVLPPLTNTSSWRLVRMMDGQYVGVLFQDGHVWLQQGNSTLKLLTTEDIPTSAGVVSINGLGGIVRLTGADIPIDNSPDPDSIRLALETEHTERVNADNSLQNALTYKSGDVFSMRAYHAAGRITNSGHGIFCWIDLAKPCTAITATINFGTKLNVFGITGATPTRTTSTIEIFGNQLSFVIDLSSTHNPGTIVIVEFDAEITLT